MTQNAAIDDRPVSITTMAAAAATEPAWTTALFRPTYRLRNIREHLGDDHYELPNGFTEVELAPPGSVTGTHSGDRYYVRGLFSFPWLCAGSLDGTRGTKSNLLWMFLSGNQDVVLQSDEESSDQEEEVATRKRKR
jgi:hypothetical protein